MSPVEFVLSIFLLGFLTRKQYTTLFPIDKWNFCGIIIAGGFMTYASIHYQPNKGGKVFVVCELPWYAILLERLIFTWPIYYWNPRITKWFYELEEKAPQVRIPITDDIEKSIKKDLWLEPEEENASTQR
jgi:hypothetical protein